MPREIVLRWQDRDFEVVRFQDAAGNWWRVDGSCLNCGACCSAKLLDADSGGQRPCPYLSFEVENGARRSACALHRENPLAGMAKPVNCALYPRETPDEEPLMPGCGYTVTREE